MAELLHRVKVFVYRMRDAAPDYLLLRGSGVESFWGPIQGPIEFGENLERAVRREVRDEVGLARPEDVIDLRLPGRWTVGDEEIIEWTFGFRSHQDSLNPLIAKRWNEFRWASYPEAYPSLELDLDRAAITRLHALLGAA